MTSIRRKALLISLCITIALLGGMMYYLQIRTSDAGPLVRVVVAAADIPPKTVLMGKQLKEIDIPQKYAITGSIKNKNEVIGKIVKEYIVTGEQVISSRLVTGKDNEGLAAIVPKGFRAITIKVDPVSGVGGHVRTGDLVDILVFLRPPSSARESVITVFQAVEVLEAGSGSKSQLDDRFLTLVMSPEDAERLFLLNEMGKFRLILRKAADDEQLRLSKITIMDYTWQEGDALDYENQGPDRQ